MIDLDELFLDKIVIHQIGNKVRGEGYQLSQEEDRVTDPNLRAILERYFLQVFKDKELYHFYHDSDIELNEVYHFTSKIFKDKENFYEQSINIAKRLYNKSDHPNIKSGDFYMVYFSNSSLTSRVIGLFKLENKDTFLKIKKENGSFAFTYDKGISLTKMEKGCLIVDDQKEGNKVYIIDSLANTGKGVAKYWESNFLNVRLSQDNEFQTRKLMKINEDFVKNIFTNELNKTPEEILEFQMKSYEYVKDNESFNKENFVNTVISNNEDKKRYEKFKEEFEVNNGLNPIDNFELSSRFIERHTRKITSKFRLDTGVDINIRKADFVEDGYDEVKNMKYLKVYYNHKI
ncbi:nucleoid-associated protein [Massilibacterium senegalense]|uniref:nucleoid-associated protein n=1 Tax=Massilibacterium senegalense TaxID=1632858 RepID=UPI000781ACEF|nr:nucleoid-associated protein [Massilibacterium senegalense]